MHGSKKNQLVSFIFDNSSYIGLSVVCASKNAYCCWNSISTMDYIYIVRRDNSDCAIIYIFVMKISIRKDMQYKFIGMKDIILSLLTGYLLIPITLFLNSLTMLFSKNYLNTSVQGMMEYPYIVQIILVAVIPPLVEEFVFRGMFYGTYRKCGILKAALVSGVVFGIFHMNINQFAYAFVVGIVLAYMVEATGSIWASVCAHFAVNTYSITVVQILKAKRCTMGNKQYSYRVQILKMQSF